MLNSYINSIKTHITDPRQGLPEEVFEFVSSVTPMVNVDLVVRDTAGQVLLSWRDDAHCGRGWHVPGGIVRYKETRADRIQKTALREFGCGVTYDPEPFAVHEIFVPQEVRGHFISFAYNCRLPDGYIIPDNLLWNEKINDNLSAGMLKWHNSTPDAWVLGQSSVYNCLFIV